MLQQTRVDTVIPYYRRFLERYPTVHALAEAPLDDVLTEWSGLGYYRRARMLHAAAKEVAARGGDFPGTAAGLRSISGIGAYTAGAVASIAFGERAALVDGNVARVLARLFAVEGEVKKGAGLARVWRLADALVPTDAPGEWNQALMELGALVCTPRTPDCGACPLSAECAARRAGRERQLPHAGPKRAPLVVERAALVFVAHERVLLARRVRDGLFGGMWEPPLIERAPEGDLRAAFGRLVGARVPRLDARGSVTHVLTHRRMEIEVLRAERRSRPPDVHLQPGSPYDALEWVLPGRPLRGLTTLARKVLACGGCAGNEPIDG